METDKSREYKRSDIDQHSLSAAVIALQLRF